MKPRRRRRPRKAASPPVPRWDHARRTLSVGGLVVKHYRVPAPNQEVVLEAFQEEGWPPGIDDPLTGDGKHDSKRRLHETIKSLNRNQTHPLIHFSGDGNGQGICWEHRK